METPSDASEAVATTVATPETVMRSIMLVLRLLGGRIRGRVDRRWARVLMHPRVSSARTRCTAVPTPDSQFAKGRRSQDRRE